MTIALRSPVVARAPAAEQSDNALCRRTIQGLVDSYASQDIDGIMAHFADDAVFCDILGKGQRGNEYHGKIAIRHAIARQFDLAGHHTYEDSLIMVEGRCAFARWTLVIGYPADRDAALFEGIDEFILDENARVTLKKAWLKGQPRLRRKLFLRQPSAMLQHLSYTLASWRH